MKRRIVGLLLCAACVVLVGCRDQGNNPEKDKQETPVLITKYYVNDSVLQYVDITIVDSCHLELGNLTYTTRTLDTLDADAEFWKARLSFFYRTEKDLHTTIPVASIKVLTLTREITTSGKYNHSIHFTRNSAAFHSTTVDKLTAMSAHSTNWAGSNYINLESSVKGTNLMSSLSLTEPLMQVNVTF